MEGQPEQRSKFCVKNVALNKCFWWHGGWLCLFVLGVWGFFFSFLFVCFDGMELRIPKRPV